MESLRLTKENTGECAKKAAEVLRAGGIVLYPTDTLYGLGADAFADDAVAKIYTLKRREEKKPIHCIVADLAMAERFAVIDHNAKILADDFFPGPLTLVLSKKPSATTGIAREMTTIGIRIPKNELCIEMARAYDGPITTTSANLSTKTTERTVEKILEQLGEAADVIDLVIDAGELPETLSSTVVDTTGHDPVIVREGAIDAADIWEPFRAEPKGN